MAKADGRTTALRKRRPSMEAPETSASLMAPFLARLGGQGRGLEYRVFESYQKNVGAMLKARTEPERMMGSTLVVRVESSALAHELTMLKSEILTKMIGDLGPDAVTDIRTRVGPLHMRMGPRVTPATPARK